MYAKLLLDAAVDNRPLLVDIEGVINEILIGYSRVPVERLDLSQIGGECRSN